MQKQYILNVFLCTKRTGFYCTTIQERKRRREGIKEIFTELLLMTKYIDMVDVCNATAIK